MPPSTPDKVEVIREQIAKSLTQTGIAQRVYSLIPRNVEAADLPAIIISPNNWRFEEYGESMSMITITYSVMVLIVPADFGTEGENEGLAIRIALAIARHFRARPGLEVAQSGDGLVYDVVVGNTNPLQLITFAGQEYLGATISLEVKDLESFAYQD